MPVQWSHPWTARGDAPALPGQIHLWWRLGSSSEEPVGAGVLSAGEQQHAEQLRRADVRRRYVANRVFVRRVLALYCDGSPRALGLSSTELGKPVLPGGPCFNLSHSGDASLLAVAAVAVGVDLEASHRPVRFGPELVFGPRERAPLPPPGDPGHGRAMLQAWVRKEAVLKARGSGFHGNSALIECVPTTGGSFDADDPDGAGWRGFDVPMMQGWLAAVVWPREQPVAAVRGFLASALLDEKPDQT